MEGFEQLSSIIELMIRFHNLERVSHLMIAIISSVTRYFWDLYLLLGSNNEPFGKDDGSQE